MELQKACPRSTQQSRRVFRSFTGLILSCRIQWTWKWTFGLFVLCLALLLPFSIRLPFFPNSDQMVFLFWSCQGRARRLKEPYSSSYQKRSSINLDGTSYAFFLWDGPILLSDFEKTLSFTKSSITIKIKNNQLFERTRWNPSIYDESIS